MVAIVLVRVMRLGEWRGEGANGSKRQVTLNMLYIWIRHVTRMNEKRHAQE